MGIEEIFNASKKPKTDKSLLSSLYEQPKKEKGVDIPHLQIFEPNYLHEADLLFMPTDDLNENKTVEKEYYKVVNRLLEVVFSSLANFTIIRTFFIVENGHFLKNRTREVTSRTKKLYKLLL